MIKTFFSLAFFSSLLFAWDMPGSDGFVVNTGHFDAWDISRGDTDGNGIIDDKNISTKIVNRDFTIRLASLNEDGTAFKEFRGSVCSRVREGTTAISDWQINHFYDKNSSDQTSEGDPHFTISKAIKEARIEMVWIFQSIPTYIDCDSMLGDAISFGSDTTGINFLKADSNDSFAIRPYALVAFVHNNYKRAGEDFNITIKAVDEGNYSKLGNNGTIDDVEAIEGYDATLNDLNITAALYQPTSDEIDTMQTDTQEENVTYCPDNGTLTINNTDEHFSNGEINASLQFNETGILNIQINEKEGSEWAKIDNDDTNKSERYIKPLFDIYDEENISSTTLQVFIPYELNTTAEYNTSTESDWLYMYDINASQHDMAASLHYTITAYNKNGDITQNFTKTCFPDISTNAPKRDELFLNTTFNLLLNIDMYTTRDVNISLYNDNNNTLNTTHEVLGSGVNHIQKEVSQFQFENGSASSQVYFNIDRNDTTPVNPVKIRLNDINTFSIKPVAAFDGSDINKSKIFFYGRSHTTRKIFTGNSGVASIVYEVYCSGADCNKSLLKGTKWSDNPKWFINPQHNNERCGSAGNIRQKMAYRITSSNNQLNATTLTYDKSRGYPYKATMEHNASKWLIYKRYGINKNNEFEVEFINNEKKWAGKDSAHSATTTKTSKRVNRRSMW